MLESICIRRQEFASVADPVDIVTLAEAMLFYQHVHLIADIAMVEHLARECGPVRLIQLLDEGFLRISYVEKGLGIANRNVDTPRQFHEPITYWHTDRRMALDAAAPRIFSAAGSAPGACRQLGRRFAQLVPTADIGDKLINEVKQDLGDSAYVEPAVERLLNVLAPDYRVPSDYFFRLTQENRGVCIETNVDFAEANTRYNARMGTTGETLNGPALLIYLFEARGDLHFASHDGAELATHEAKSAVLGVKFGELLSARAGSQSGIEAFQTLVLSNSHEIGESLKYRYRTWDEYLILLRKAQRFKAWLSQQPSDASLIHEYLKALEKDTSIGSLPAKSVRFLIFQGIGAVAPGIVSTALSTVDNFLLERLVGGWKPSQFVRGPLKKDFARQD